MKPATLLFASAALAISAPAALAQSVTFTDSTNDLFDNTLTHLDITSVTVSNDDTWVYFAIQTAGNLDSPTWGKYMIALDAQPGGANSNGWGRNINHGVNNDFWVGSWTDDYGSGTGAQLYDYNDGDGNWELKDAYVNGSSSGLITGSDADHDAGIQRLTVSIAALGLNIGDSFGFDVMSSGGGPTDSGIDHLSNPMQATGGYLEQSQAGTYLQYTLQSTIIPLPGAAGMALAGMGMVGLRRRR